MSSANFFLSTLRARLRPIDDRLAATHGYASRLGRTIARTHAVFAMPGFEWAGYFPRARPA